MATGYCAGMAQLHREHQQKAERERERFWPRLARGEPWWRETRFDEPLLADGELTMTALVNGEDPWVLGLSKWEIEGLTISEPYWLVFPTPGDFLLWLRWLWLPMVCHGHDALSEGPRSELELQGPPLTLATFIDELPFGSDVDSAIDEVAPMLPECRLCWSPPLTIGPLRDRDTWLVKFAARQMEELPYGPA